MKRILIFIVLSQINFVFAGESKKTIVYEEEEERSNRFFEKLPITLLDGEYSDTVLDWQNTVTEKPLYILRRAQEGKIKNNDLIISGAFWGSYMYEESNVAGKFPILSRFPSQHGNTSKNGEEWVVNNLAFGITARLGSWLTTYAQPEYTEIEFPGQEEWELRKAYVMLGNLEKFPLYAYFGRNTVDFGLNNGFNPFTHTVSNHFYRVDARDSVIGLGFYKKGLHIVGTLIPSGRQWRVADTKDDDGWENGALFVSYNKNFENGLGFKIGGSYLHSTIYNYDVPNHPGAGFAGLVAQSQENVRNAAVNGFAQAHWNDFRVGIEYTTTLKDWPATDAKVQAWNFQTAYDTKLFNIPMTLSAVYGLGLQGPNNTEYEKLSQLVVGLEIKPCKKVAIGLEYVRNEDFVPLINITQVSDSNVSTNTFIAGIKIYF